MLLNNARCLSYKLTMMLDPRRLNNKCKALPVLAV